MYNVAKSGKTADIFDWRFNYLDSIIKKYKLDVDIVFKGSSFLDLPQTSRQIQMKTMVGTVSLLLGEVSGSRSLKDLTDKVTRRVQTMAFGNFGVAVAFASSARDGISIISWEVMGNGGSNVLAGSLSPERRGDEIEFQIRYGIPSTFPQST